MTIADIITEAARAGLVTSATIRAASDADLDARVDQFVRYGAESGSDRVIVAASDGAHVRMASLWAPGVHITIVCDRTAMLPGAVVTEQAA